MLCLCDWRYRKMRQTVDDRITRQLSSAYAIASNPTIANTIKQIDEYLEGTRKEFDLPLLLVGTDFQKRVWNSLQNIPYGTTNTYLGLAKSMNQELAIRAIAAANGANAISIIVPCHRIIGSSGELVGYAGGLETKKQLLSLENPQFQNNNQLSLF